MIVRRIAPADIEEIERIVTAAYGYPLSPPVRLRLRRDPLAVVAEREGGLAGCGMLDDFGTVGYIGSMAVGPAVRTSGAGATIVEALITAAHERGHASLALVRGAGFYETRRLRHMIRGEAVIRRHCVYGQASMGHG